MRGGPAFHHPAAAAAAAVAEWQHLAGLGGGGGGLTRRREAKSIATSGRRRRRLPSDGPVGRPPRRRRHSTGRPGPHRRRCLSYNRTVAGLGGPRVGGGRSRHDARVGGLSGVRCFNERLERARAVTAGAS